MKDRKMSAPRRLVVAAVKFKSGAGSHTKKHKAVRRREKMDLTASSSIGQSKGLLIPRLRVRLSPRRPEYLPKH
jgi:uncharacterized protein YfiM (DUF2279 family)